MSRLCYYLRMDRRVAARGIIVKDGKLLAIKLKDYESDGARALGHWITPGGKVDPKESLTDAIQREIKEELGVDAVVGNLLYIQQFTHHDTEQLEFFFHITNADDFTDIDLTKTSHGQKEVDEIDFIDTAESNVLPEFLRDESFEDVENKTVKLISYL